MKGVSNICVDETKTSLNFIKLAVSYDKLKFKRCSGAENYGLQVNFVARPKQLIFQNH